MWKLILLFTVVPAVELFLLLQIGAWLGPLQTFAIIVLTGTLGAWLAKREGLGVLLQLREELQNGMPPGSRIFEGVLVVVGGLLLVTPGVFTDLAGFLLIAPPSRRWLAPRLLARLATMVDMEGVSVGPMGPGPNHRSRNPNNPFSNPFDDLP